MFGRMQLIVLVLITAIIVIALFVVGDQNEEVDGLGDSNQPALILPGLQDELNNIENIQISHKGNQFAINKVAIDGDKFEWQVSELNKYPADVNKIRELLFGLSELTKIESKTRKVEKYAILGLTDPNEKESTATGITLFKANSEKVAEVIVGNDRPSRGESSVGNASDTEYYMRIPGDPQTWLTVGHLLYDIAAAIDYVDQNIVQLETNRVKEVEVFHDGSERVKVIKMPQSEEFVLADLQEGEEIDSNWRINDIGGVFNSLRFDGVTSSDSNLLDSLQPVRISALTEKGLRIEMHIFEKVDKHYVKLNAQAEVASDEATEPEQEAQSATSKVAEEANTNDETQTVEKSDQQTTAEKDQEKEDKTNAKDDEVENNNAIIEEAKVFNANWSKWIFEVPSYKVSTLLMKRSELLKSEEEANESSESAASPTPTE